MAVTVVALRSSPLKGVSQGTVPALDLIPGGLRGDRRFGLVAADGQLLYGGYLDPLAGVAATWDPERDVLALAMPDGERVEARVEETGESVELVASGGEPRSGRLVGGPFAEALSARAGQPLRLVRLAPGTAAPGQLTLIARASLARLGEELGDPALDPRRFRMNVELDGLEAYEEDGWEGRLLALGGAVVRVGGPVPRCVLTTRHPDTRERDRDTLRAILAHRAPMSTGQAPLGVYATVERPGRVVVGDAAIVLA